MTYFLATFEKIGLLLMSTSGHTKLLLLRFTAFGAGMKGSLFEAEDFIFDLAGPGRMTVGLVLIARPNGALRL